MTKLLITNENGAKFYGCECQRDLLPWLNAEGRRRGIVKVCFDVVQGGYSNSRVKASALTHNGGGAWDIAQNDDRTDDLFEESGQASFQRRPPAFDPHIHSLLIGCPHLHDDARDQVDDWFDIKDGLRWHLADFDRTRPTPRTWQQWVKQQKKIHKRDDEENLMAIKVGIPRQKGKFWYLPSALSSIWELTMRSAENSKITRDEVPALRAEVAGLSKKIDRLLADKR